VITSEQDTELRSIARDTYKKVCIGRPHMPHPDSDEGQRKIERLYDIARRAVSGRKNARPPSAAW
jgi:hypothetical protein